MSLIEKTICPDCMEEVEILKENGLCPTCSRRKAIMKEKYIAIKSLSEKDRKRILKLRESSKKLILNIKNSQSDIPQQNNKSECLILQHQHQKDRQANNKNERRYTNQQKI